MMMDLRDAQRSVLHLYADYVADGTVPQGEMARVLHRLAVLHTRPELVDAARAFGVCVRDHRKRGRIPHATAQWRPV